MVTIGIVGGGRAATLHADAVLHSRGAELIGVGGRPGRATDLATNAGVPDAPIDDLCCADAVIVAVTPGAIPDVVAAINGAIARHSTPRAVLVEGPVPVDIAIGTAAMVGSNLLHAPVVRQALREIATMSPHHLELRARQPAPHHGDTGARVEGPLLDPGARLAAVLLAAAGEPALSATVTGSPDTSRVGFALQSGRSCTLDVGWSAASARTELEVADRGGVVSLTCDPLPRLEIGGEPVAAPDLHPLEALGFVGQIDRLVKVAQGRADPWLDLAVGSAIRALLGP